MYDVIIVGGGPAGSTAATLLAQRGMQVLVLERAHFPREHIGESLLPATLAILEQLGVLPAVRAGGFTVKRGATMQWGATPEPWSWYFAETNQRFPTSFQVWRPHFDEILLNHSQACGAHVRFGAHVSQFRFDRERCIGVTLADGAQLDAQVVIDASGQRALLARQRNLLQFDEFFRNLAIYSYFAGGERLPAPDEGNIFIESYEEGWCWNIPLRVPSSIAVLQGQHEWMSVGFVVDRDRALPRLHAIGAEALLRDQIQRASRTAAMLTKATQVRPAQVLQDWSYRASEFSGEGWVLAGDAACFIDPLFSTGVHLAVTAGLLAAALALPMCGDDDALTRAAGATYAYLYGTQYEHFHRLARLFYSGNRSMTSYFWEARRLLGEELGEDQGFGPRESFVRAVSGQAPAGYERSVLAQGDLPDGFVQAIGQVQRGRAERRSEMNSRRAALPNVRARRGDGVAIERRAVLGTRQFEWGEVITAIGRDDLVPCSPLVSALIRNADGVLTLQALAEKLASETTQQAKVLAGLCAATEVLYVDGLIDALL